MAKRKRITLERLQAVLRYDPKTGSWTWLERGSGRRNTVGAIGVNNGRRSRVIFVDGHRYYAHILAYFYMIGRWPPRGIDHHNLDATDNRWVNLRLATHQENCQNRRPKKGNISGIRGVSWYKPYSKWVVRLSGKHFGYYDTLEEAREVRDREAERLYGRFFRKGD